MAITWWRWFIVAIFRRRWWFIMAITWLRRRFIMAIAWGLSILFYVVSERWSVHRDMISPWFMVRLIMLVGWRMVMKKHWRCRVLVMVMWAKDRNHSSLGWWRRWRWRRCYRSSRSGPYVIVLIDIVHNVIIIIVSTNDIRHFIHWNHLNCCLLRSPTFLGPWSS